MGGMTMSQFDQSIFTFRSSIEEPIDAVAYDDTTQLLQWSDHRR